ncbi:MAG TPA: metallophosphoesterase [Solirubrobacterales bacterium]|nr:metallophosphoesterase [Solirubrobacterales bacterium]
MSLILHLSDLHLGSPSPFQLDYEDKVGLDEVAGETGETAGDHLGHTLQAIGESLGAEGRTLDSIVVTGDLTKANKPDGYAEFDGVLERLGEARPPEEKVVVVPGNHDVDDERRAGDPLKLALFMGAVRPRYATPLIKGLDYEGADLNRDPGERGAAHPIVELSDAVILAINSADYCFVEGRRTETDWDAVLGDYLAGEDSIEAKTKREQAAIDLRKLRTHDIAKVDKRQIEALEERLDAVGIRKDDDPDSDPRLRIAAIHHPITAASGQEEIKPFEVITNLARVRTFLFHHGFHLILHGHKHASYAAWDWLAPPRENLDLIPRRALVLGAPARFRPGESVCRLIEVCPDDEGAVAGAPRLRVLTIKGVDGSERLELPFSRTPKRSLAQPAFLSTDRNVPWVIEAKSADAAYQQLRDLPLAEDANRAVISVVEDPASTQKLPTNYPEREDMPSLKDIVDWWQHPRPEAVRALSGSVFNHGERLYGYGDHENAISEAVTALPSSKAFALLVRPGEPGRRDRKFPAFSEVQLQVRKAATDRYLLDVVGTYRKQDLKLWWPVNMAELAHIQAIAVKAANDESPIDKASFLPGRLISITSQGVHEDVLPQMAGTTIDRAVDLRPEWIYRLSYLAARPDSNAEDAVEEWRRALGDVGERSVEGLLVPSVGLDRLLAALGTHEEVTGQRSFVKLLAAVEKLRERAAQAEETLRDQKNPRTGTLDSLGAELKELVEGCEEALRSRASEVAGN